MRFGKMLKWTGAILGGAAVVAALIIAWWIHRSYSELERRLAALREARQPVSLADLHADLVPPEVNAAVYLAKAQEGLQAIEAEIQKAEQATDDDMWDANYLSNEWPERSPKRLLEATRAGIAAHPDVLPLLEKAADCPTYSIDEIAGNIDPVADSRNAIVAILDRSRFHQSIARLLAENWFGCLMQDGKRDEAMQACTTLLRLSRHLEKEPLVGGFVDSACFRTMAIRSANKAIQTGPISEDVIINLEHELEKHELWEPLCHGLTTERAATLDMIHAAPIDGRLTGSYSIGKVAVYLDEADCFLQRARNGGQGPPFPLTTSLAGMYGTELRPGLFLLGEIWAKQAETMIRAMRVLLALPRRAEPDRPPAADLSDLGLPEEATLDPFNGQPLVVKRVEGGWLIYSVGENLVDDGGAIEDYRDVGIGPPKENVLKER